MFSLLPLPQLYWIFLGLVALARFLKAPSMERKQLKMKSGAEGASTPAQPPLLEGKAGRSFDCDCGSQVRVQTLKCGAAKPDPNASPWDCLP